MGNEIRTSQADQDLKALESFLVSNRDLERLEALLDRFNILEALGVVRQELRHSDFLAFLMDPKGNHGLGDAFVRRLLQRVLMVTGDIQVFVTPLELELWSLDRMEVRREWQHIDILLLDEDHKLAVIVENKIGSGERPGQLQKHLDILVEHHRGWNVVPLFLTPDGTPPSEVAYLAVDYGVVCEVIDGVAEGHAAIVNPDLKTLMTHYTEMLRRQIVDDSRVAELCRQIYQQHGRAIELIYKHRPDIQTELRTELEALVEEEANLVADHSNKHRVRFSVEGWDTPELLTAENWTPSERILLFEFFNDPDDLRLNLMVGPGKDDVRQRLFDMATANPEVLRRPSRTPKRWGAIYSCPFLDGRLYEAEVSEAERTKEIRKRWAEFLQDDLPRIDAALKRERWVWK